MRTAKTLVTSFFTVLGNPTVRVDYLPFMDLPHQVLGCDLYDDSCLDNVCPVPVFGSSACRQQIESAPAVVAHQQGATIQTFITAGDVLPPHLRHIRFASAITLAGHLFGCEGNPRAPCVPGLHTGDVIQVTVLDAYDQNSRFVYTRPSPPPVGTCASGFDVADGDALTIDVGTIEPGLACGAFAFSVRPFNDVTIGQADSFGGSALLDGVFPFARGTCKGDWLMTLSLEQGDNPFAESVESDGPIVTMQRTFFLGAPRDACLEAGSALATADRCFDEFVVQLKRISP